MEKLLFILIPIIIILIIITMAISKILNTIKRASRDIRNVASNIKTVTNLIDKIDDVEVATPKSVGGATQMFLKKIESDLKDFHAPDAENAIKTFIIEFLDIKYRNKEKFETSKTNDNILLNINRQSKANISNIVFNGIAIYNYKKTKDYHTITYKVSVGYDINGKRIETRYEIDYTLQLLDNNIATKSLKCPNCGGIYSSINDSSCPYCGTGIIKDTIMNWFVTEIIEL